MTMTNKDILLRIIAEATGKSLADIEHIADKLHPGLSSMGKLDQQLSDEDANKLLAKLRQDLPGIRRWLQEGRLLHLIDLHASKPH